MKREDILARLAEIRDEAEELDTELRGLSEAEELDETQEARFSELMGEGDGESPFLALKSEKEKLQKRLAVLAAADESRNIEVGEQRAPQFMKRTETDIDLRTASRHELRSAALKVLETEHKEARNVEVSDRSAGHIEKLVGAYSVAEDGDVILDGSQVAKRMLVTETPAYRSAFQKALKGKSELWSDDERNAMRAAEQSLTNASGGYAVPVLIDPTVILTSGAAGAPVVDLARVEPITNNVWKGVSSAGVAFENLAENTAATAKQVTLAQPSVTAHKIAAFVPFSLEIEGDWPNFAGEMSRLINQAYVDYLAEKTITGTGTIEMFGIVTALDATAGSEIAVTTDGALGPEDALKLWSNVPERYRRTSNWLSDVSVESEFRKNGGDHGLFTVSLTSEGIGVINGRRYYTTDYMTSFDGTTGAANLAVLGDFQNYVIAQRVGMSIELIPHVFDGSGLPKGQRGYFAWARVGGDSVNDGAFRLLQNQ